MLRIRDALGRKERNVQCRGEETVQREGAAVPGEEVLAWRVENTAEAKTGGDREQASLPGSRQGTLAGFLTTCGMGA